VPFNAVVIDLEVSLAVAIEIDVHEAIDAHVLDVVVRYDDRFRIRCDHGAEAVSDGVAEERVVGGRVGQMQAQPGRCQNLVQKRFRKRGEQIAHLCARRA
jgi:hypothetical protein